MRSQKPVILKLARYTVEAFSGRWFRPPHAYPALESPETFLSLRVIGRNSKRAKQRFTHIKVGFRKTEKPGAAQIDGRAFDPVCFIIPKKENGPMDRGPDPFAPLRVIHSLRANCVSRRENEFLETRHIDNKNCEIRHSSFATNSSSRNNYCFGVKPMHKVCN